jgi:GDPmannose 4,6-dehydratase
MGLTGQDGSFLAELLLEQGYQVTGLVRPADGDRLGCAEHMRGRVALVRGDLLEPDSLIDAVATTNPDELYHLAAPSFVPDSWRRPAETVAAIAGATATVLEAVRDRSPETRVFVAATGEIFGDAPESPQREDTVCRPRTPYAAAKLAAHQLAGLLRARDGIFVCSGILYNHESERRPPTFVSRKITRAVAAIKLRIESRLKLGDLTAVRDWSFAGDIMQGAWLMLQQPEPDDYILASGIPHTVADLVRAAFAAVGLNPDAYVEIDDTLVRAPEAVAPVGDPSRARGRLRWHPTLTFEQLIERMVAADLEVLGS